MMKPGLMPRSLSRSLGVLVGMGMVLLGASSVLAQSTVLQPSTAPQPLPNFNSGEQSDPFSNRGSGQVNGIFDLIHRSVLGPNRSVEEFSTEQSQNLDAAATQFLIQRSQTSAQPTNQPQPTNQSKPAPVTPAPAAVPATGK